MRDDSREEKPERGTKSLLHFSFDQKLFERVFAHGGARPILAWRALDNKRGAACNFLDLVIIPPGGVIGVHTHKDDNEEVYVIVSGRGTMLSEGVQFSVAHGDVVVNQPGGTHGLWNTGDADIRLVVVEIPVSAGS